MQLVSPRHRSSSIWPLFPTKGWLPKFKNEYVRKVTVCICFNLKSSIFMFYFCICVFCLKSNKTLIIKIYQIKNISSIDLAWEQVTEIQQNMGILRQTSSQHLLEHSHFLTCQPLTTQNPRELESPNSLSHEFLIPQILPQAYSSWTYMALGKLGPWVTQRQGAEWDPPPQTRALDASYDLTFIPVLQELPRTMSPGFWGSESPWSL